MEMYMDNILHEAFVNMFQENPDLKEKFIASKENAANGRRRKYICNLILWISTIWWLSLLDNAHNYLVGYVIQKTKE